MKVRLYHLPVDLPEGRAPRGPAINIMPVGLLALADCLERAGHAAEVVHVGVERRLDGAFDVVADVEAAPVDLVGFALHWHPQIGPVGDAVEGLHAARPDLPVVLGGMTATAFAEPILARWAGVDAVVCGEAEGPLVALAARLAAGDRDWADLPNLVTRDCAGLPHRSGAHYVASQADLDALEFCRLELLRHGDQYNGQFARSASGWSHPPVFYLGVGRGCSVDCAFCSGGRSGHRRLAGRREVVFRSVPRVLDDLARLADQGIQTVAICFDPPGRSEAYYRELFGAVAALAHRPAVVFECYQPPSTELLDAFAAAVRPEGSRLSFSPTVGDAALRSRLLGVRYDNDALERALAHCSRLGVPTTLYFATVPQESLAQLDASLAWQRRLVAVHGCRIIHAPIEMEPEAPWNRDPVKYGITAVRTGFDAFERRHRDRPSYGVRYQTEVGFDFPDVDARVVRVASALLEPQAWLATALATSGLGAPSRLALVGLGQLAHALELLGELRGLPLVLLVAALEPPPPWENLAEVAERLGPNVQYLPFDPRRLRHRQWTGASVPAPPPAGTLQVLHLADAVAVQRVWDHGLEQLGAGLVVAELCRWANAPCPASRPGFLALGQDATVRCCPSAPDLGEGPLSAIAARLHQRREDIVRARGCERCPEVGVCSQCLFPGRLSAPQFCALRRQRGRGGLPGASGLLSRFAAIGGVDIGWDG